MQTKNSARLALAFFFALALAGCGGGGGSSGSGVGAVSTTQNPYQTLAGRTRNSGANLNARAQTAANAIPRQGSVTQSSTVDSGNGVTLDQISVTASYDNANNLRMRVTNSRAGSWGSAGSGDVFLAAADERSALTGRTYRSQAFSKRTGSGEVFVATFTDRLNAAQTDYLAGGVWGFVPNNIASLSDVEIGSFFDGSIALTPTDYLTTTATASYRGDAAGLFVEQYNGAYFVGAFDGGISLNARFGSSATVSGTVQINEAIAVDTSGAVHNAVVGNPTLQLGVADIDTSAAGGFFTGDTSASFTVTGANGVSITETYAGKWGGQFHGAQAQTVGGTFGASITSTTLTGHDLSFVGTYGAYKQ